MKKILLAGSALIGAAVLSAPAHAEIKTDLGGFFRGYGVYANNDETSTAAAGTKLDKFEFRRDNEIHFNGETTLDNGLTVGAHTELQLGGAAFTDETYAYFSGGWGRVNFGTEDGAAYLLQVAAPSADSNVDGLRPYISGLNSSVWNDHLVAGAANNAGLLQNFDSYQQADFRHTDRITYLSPKFNGFQAGVSYAPQPVSYAAPYSGLQPMAASNTTGAFSQLWEGAARWDGEFQGFGISVGGGYSYADDERSTGITHAGTVGSSSAQTWNGAANVTFQGFSVGGGYKWTDNGIDTGATGSSADTHMWFAGLGWDNGPYHLGGSYLNSTADAGAGVLTANTKATLQQYALGGGYTFGPGMTFRGAFEWGNVDNKVAAGAIKTDYQQATVGTDIQF